MNYQVNDSFSSEVEIYDEVNIKQIIQTKTLREDEKKNLDDGFYICNIGDIVNKHKLWLQFFPRIVPYYAMKCAPYEPMLKCLIGLSVGVCCDSKVEMEMAIRLGADPKKMLFYHPWKQPSHLEFAKNKGVQMLVIDGMEELKKVKKIFPSSRILIRLGGFPDKYGASEQECENLIATAKDMALETVGICFYIQDVVETIQHPLQISRRLFDFAAQLGVNLSILDIGGCFPGVINEADSFQKNVASLINAKIEEHFPLDLFKELKIISEPGKYYASSAFSIAVNVAGKRKVAEPDKEVGNKRPAPNFMYYLNDGLYGAFSYFRTTFDNEAELFLLKEYSSELYLSRIWGPVGSNQDLVEDEVMLPELNIGDWLLWKNMGAYTFSLCGNFCGYRTTAFYNVMSKDSLALLKEISGKEVFTNLAYYIDRD